MNEFLRIENVSKKFESTKALNGVSFGVQKGTIFGLLGPNGAGKTTLIRIINSIFLPDDGTVFLDNQPLSAEYSTKIGYLPEERGLYKKMKVGEQIIFFGMLKGLDKLTAENRARQWLKKFDIISWWDKKVEELSKGMAQKVQFIITVLHEPPLLIFDEPFSGFDPINVDLIQNEILEFKKNGTTIIFSAHNMASVEEICDDIVLINKGQIILSGNILDVKNRFSDNSYEIAFESAPNSTKLENYELLEHQNKLPHSFRVTITENNVNDFLAEACKVGKVVYFNKLIPSLHDIFVSEVQKFNQNTNENE